MFNNNNNNNNKEVYEELVRMYYNNNNCLCLPAGRVHRIVRVEDRIVLDSPHRMLLRRQGMPGVLPRVSQARADSDRSRAPVHIRHGPHGCPPRGPQLGVRERAHQGPVPLQVAGRSPSLPWSDTALSMYRSMDGLMDGWID